MPTILRPNNAQASHDITDDHLNPPPTQTFFEQHAVRSVTSPLPSTSRPYGHYDALALNKQAGVAKRDLEQNRSQSFKRLVDMRDRCLTCQVFGRTPCGNQDPFRCPIGIYGYRCQYMVDGETLPTLYANVYKEALRKFDRSSRICWICYFPFSYKTHSKEDDVCQTQKDILNPVAWALFCLPIVLSPPVGQALQDKLLHVAGITTPIFESLEIYSQWLPKAHPTVKNTANIVELCIAFEHLYHAKDWP